MKNTEANNGKSPLERLEESVKVGAQRIYVPSYVREEALATIESIAEDKGLRFDHPNFEGDFCEIVFKNRSATHSSHE
ncbi:MAG: hypothetical protein A3A33_03515 [Candidatus Yanofskybacteria bacterium RIFCSPLOWO2_01_FULL_49_25]|uniref:Uncharacterized protein n=1 Tax=Candidatus Yanofskybacteria bacterium RIFCSPLOWO2_01_FULL_49_25 TaxID=1802701 RepID=A0A1F8GWH5_9BACT|nr:MAG: hypothetical protein A3A33_03515 [Candidatus Yanofskybacteria bacterium RIFCSPLOWO2_01_FULL_49_25]